MDDIPRRRGEDSAAKVYSYSIIRRVRRPRLLELGRGDKGNLGVK